jgi:hypothetical protein
MHEFIVFFLLQEYTHVQQYNKEFQLLKHDG